MIYKDYRSATILITEENFIDTKLQLTLMLLLTKFPSQNMKIKKIPRKTKKNSQKNQ